MLLLMPGSSPVYGYDNGGRRKDFSVSTVAEDAGVDGRTVVAVVNEISVRSERRERDGVDSVHWGA